MYPALPPPLLLVTPPCQSSRTNPQALTNSRATQLPKLQLKLKQQRFSTSSEQQRPRRWQRKRPKACLIDLRRLKYSANKEGGADGGLGSGRDGRKGKIWQHFTDRATIWGWEHWSQRKRCRGRRRQSAAVRVGGGDVGTCHTCQ